MRGEDIGQPDHRAHQRVDVARPLSADAFKHFVAAQLSEHSAGLFLIDGQKANSYVFQNFDKDSAKPDHQKWAVLWIRARADEHFGSLHHLLNQ